jgi:hypothetical protein
MDKPFVNRLILRLREAGIPEPWYDAFELDAATENIRRRIEEAIDEFEWFALVLSPASDRSQWVTFEIQAALQAHVNVIALLHDSPNGHLGYLGNPHVSALLSGGQRKVVNFTDGFDRALADLLLVIAPEVGLERDTALTISEIIENENPDLAERAMSRAALHPDRFLPPLIEKLPELRNDRKLRLRVEGALASIGRPAIDPLLDFAFRQADVTPRASILPPDIDPLVVDERGVEHYVNRDAIALIRHIILSGGDLAWSAQLGAEYALVALARRDRSLGREIVEGLQTELARAANRIASQAGEPVEDFIDVLRIVIETVGLAAESGTMDAFLLHQFVTSELWGPMGKYAKEKLSSYVTEALARSGSNKALDYLESMLGDPEIVSLYFVESRSPNPWEEAFVPFGARGMDRVLKIVKTASAALKPTLYLNLAQIRHPLGLRAALNWTDEEQSDLVATDVLLDVANVGLPEACDTLLERYSAGAFDRFATGPFADRVLGAAVVAARSATDSARAIAVCADLIDREDVSLQVELARTIPAIGAHELYDRVLTWLDGHDSPYVRAAAAIALSEHRVLKEPDKLLKELQYADPDMMAPRIGVALSYFRRPEAVEPLARGLRVSLLGYEDALHDQYAQALERIDSDTAREARATWYQRI